MRKRSSAKLPGVSAPQRTIALVVTRRRPDLTINELMRIREPAAQKRFKSSRFKGSTSRQVEEEVTRACRSLTA